MGSLDEFIWQQKMNAPRESTIVEVLINNKWIAYNECSQFPIDDPRLKKVGISRVYRINGGRAQTHSEGIHYHYTYIKNNKYQS